MCIELTPTKTPTNLYQQQLHCCTHHKARQQPRRALDIGCVVLGAFLGGVIHTAQTYHFPLSLSLCVLLRPRVYRGGTTAQYRLHTLFSTRLQQQLSPPQHSSSSDNEVLATTSAVTTRLWRYIVGVRLQKLEKWSYTYTYRATTMLPCTKRGA